MSESQPLAGGSLALLVSPGRAGPAVETATGSIGGGRLAAPEVPGDRDEADDAGADEDGEDQGAGEPEADVAAGVLDELRGAGVGVHGGVSLGGGGTVRG